MIPKKLPFFLVQKNMDHNFEQRGRGGEFDLLDIFGIPGSLQKCHRLGHPEGIQVVTSESLTGQVDRGTYSMFGKKQHNQDHMGGS